MDLWRIIAIGVSFMAGLSSALKILGPSEVRVRVMSDVSLLCVGDGDLVWLRDGVELLEGGYVSLTAEGRLVLTSISITETGPYECNNGSHSEFITISLTSDQASYNMIRNGVVGGVIGVCGLVLVVGLLICGLVLCVHNKDKASDLEDEMTYEYKELYVATLDMDALDKLDPHVRAKIDLNFLAQLTHTDPSLLTKYQGESCPPQEPHPPVEEEPIKQDSNSSCNVSVTSLHQVYVDSLDIAKHISHHWTKAEPRPLKHRETVVTMETPKPKKLLRKQASVKSFTSLDGGHNSTESGLGVRQDFLRILKMVPLQQEVAEDREVAEDN